MENTEITAINTNNTSANTSVPAEATPRKRERGNFTGRRMTSFDQLDASQYPRRREDYVPMWAQEMKAQIDLLSQGQQKIFDLLLDTAKAVKAAKDDAAVLKEIKVLEANVTQLFNQVLGNQSSGFQGLYNGLRDVHGMLQAAQQKKISWWHPIQKIKELWAEHVKAVKQKKAAKLQQQLMQLRGELDNNK